MVKLHKAQLIKQNKTNTITYQKTLQHINFSMFFQYLEGKIIAVMSKR